MYANILRKLQDLCSISGELPSSYWIPDVELDRGDIIGRGGEALVFAGYMGLKKVVVREVPKPRQFWRTPAGQNLRKVREEPLRLHSVSDDEACSYLDTPHPLDSLYDAR